MARILIVDDNEMFRKRTREFFEVHFPENRLLEAKDAKTAFDLIESHRPHLIFMDIKLSGKSGLEMTRQIKQRFPSIMVVMLTNFDLEEYRKAAFESGAEAFLCKSTVSAKTLVELVRKTISHP
jgi:DNA-binding NarL/FixJ family response regulator